MATVKPQTPLMLGDNYILPITSYDQIVMPNGSRWDGSTGGGSGGSITTDATLKKSGQAADAKATGDAIQVVSQQIASETTAREEAISSLSQQMTDLQTQLMPDVTEADAGKFLRVDSTGKWAVETIPVWEGGEY